MKTEKRGGKRENAGRPEKYNEPTQKISLRVPESKVIEVRELVYGYLNKFKCK